MLTGLLQIKLVFISISTLCLNYLSETKVYMSDINMG